MIPPELVTEAVKSLAPTLPALLAVGDGALKEIGKTISAAALENGKKMWTWLQPHAEARPALLEAAQEVATHPEDVDAQGALRVEVRKLLETHPNLVPELQGLVQQVAVQQNSVTASGAGSVAIGGNITGSTIRLNPGVPTGPSPDGGSKPSPGGPGRPGR